MNNPLAQKYNYYLNESYRLSEELKTEQEYSELLENVLFELLGEKDFTKLFEYVMQGSVTHDASGKPLSPEKSARRAKRIGQIVDIGRKTAAGMKGAPDSWGPTYGHKMNRVAASLVAKGVDVADPDDHAGAVPKRDWVSGEHDDPGTASSHRNVMHALKLGGDLQAGKKVYHRYTDNKTGKAIPPMIQQPTSVVKTGADERQKRLSKFKPKIMAVKNVKKEKDQNTF